MKLLLNEASPYARLVRVVLAESGLHVRTELVYVDPWESSPELLAANPAAKVPVLVLDDGTALVESGCIVDHLLRWPGGGGAALAPRSSARLGVLGLGRAAMDCAFGAVLQGRFHGQSGLADRWLAALGRIATGLEAGLAGAPAAPGADVADLTVAVAFEYVDFRLPTVPWRGACPSLAGHVDALGRRGSLIATRPR